MLGVPALWVEGGRDQSGRTKSMKKPSDPTIAEKFNTYRFVDNKEKVIYLLKRVTMVSVGVPGLNRDGVIADMQHAGR